MVLSSFVSTSNSAHDKMRKRREKNKQIILEYLKQVGGASSVKVMWDLQNEIKPVMPFMVMATFLRRLEFAGDVEFKDSKYMVKVK